MSPVELGALHSIALASLLAWASGVRLYFVMFALGLSGHLDWYTLPEGLKVLQNPWVMGSAGLMLAMEFLVDKVPGLDSAWDAIHTFIRIPAGALLAAGATGDTLSAMTIAAGIIGGTITAGTHFTKSGSRALINTSPEPFSNWGASIGEDAAVVTGFWLALMHPAVFLGLLAIFLLLVMLLLPRLWRGVRKLYGFLQARLPAAAPPRQP